MNLSELSDEELMSLRGQLTELSDAELLAMREPKQTGSWYSPVRQALQGLTFGLSDELGAGAAAIPASIVTKRNPFDVYDEMHQALGDERKQYRKENPGKALAFELAGGLATGGVGASKILPRLPAAWSTLGKLMATGAAEGGLYGAAAADQGERAVGGAIGASMGSLGAPAGRAVGSVGRGVGRYVAPKAKHVLFGSPVRDARRELVSILAREGVDNLDELAAQGGRLPRTLADVSEGAKSAAAGIAAGVDNPNIAKISNTFLRDRNKALTSRTLSSLDEALDLPSNITVRDAVKAVAKSKSEAAAKLYGEAAKVPYKPSRYVETMLGEKGPNEVRAALKDAVSQLGSARAAGEKVGHFDLVDQLKKNLDDRIMVHMRQGSKHAAKNLIKIKNNILKDIDSQNPAYKQARDSFAGHSALEDAAERGKALFKDDVEDLTDYLKTLSDSEKTMHLFGVKQAVRDKLMAGREGTMTLNRISSQSNLERLKAAFPSEKAFNAFKRELDEEAAAFETYRLISQGSKTGLVQAAQRNLGKQSVEAVGHDTPSIIANGLDRLLHGGLSRGAKEELGRMILTPLRDLPPELIDELSGRVIAQTSPASRTQVGLLLKELSEASYGAGMGALTVPVSQGMGAGQ